MLQLATADMTCFEVSDYEIQQGGTSYLIDTAQRFAELDPSAELFWIIGADQFEQLDQWRTQIGAFAFGDFSGRSSAQLRDRPEARGHPQ